MINAIRTLMAKYRNRKIYIWDIERESICLFIKMAFRRVNIAGFVTLQEEFVGEMYMNCPILALDTVMQDEESIIVLYDTVPKEMIKRMPEDKIVVWSQAQEINEDLHLSKAAIYGVGNAAMKLYEDLAEEGVIAEVSCVARKEDLARGLKGKRAITVDELCDYQEYALLIPSETVQRKMEPLERLSGFGGEIYVDIENYIDCTDQTNLIQNIDLAIKRFAEIYFYGKRNLLTEFVAEILCEYGIQIKGYVYDIEDRKNRIQNLYELVYEKGVENKLIIIVEETPEEIVEAREYIEFAGFSLERENYTGIQWYTRAKEIMLSEWQTRTDPMVGWSVFYPQDKPGWKIYGKEEEGIRILVLGGSTSSEEYHSENWISKLYYKLNKRGIKTTIYNGAHPGNDIVDEILRLLRDGYVLRPQIVISMSGINNCHRKESTSQFNEERLIDWVKVIAPDQRYCSGLDSDESLYTFWSRNIRLLKLISNYYGAQFFGFLQPINAVMPQMTLRERSLYADSINDSIYQDFRESANDENGYINILQLLEHHDGVIFDGCHYTETAHEMIASKVYDAIMPAIQRILRG